VNICQRAAFKSRLCGDKAAAILGQETGQTEPIAFLEEKNLF
jgi:hypothetical protein